MLILLIAVVVVGVSGYIWCTRGFFSALLHMFCVFAAGAIAFGVWEPLSYFLLSKAPDRGALAFLADIPFAIGLFIPFALSLALLRAAVDKLLPANAQCDTAVDYAGGAVCGLVSGVITAGIIVLSIGFLRVKPDFGGYQPVVYATGTARGSLERTPNKLVPWVDRITAGLYEKLSLTTLRTGDPLAKYHPDLDAEGGANRQTYEGKSRTGIKRSAFDLVGWYTVGDFQKPTGFDQLSRDSFQQTPQNIADLNGEPITRGALAGYILNFGSAAREKTGQVVIGAGQLRLVCESQEEEDFKTVHPVAVVSRVNDPTAIHYARFRFDSDGFFVSSVGGESQAVLGFEFPVPAGYTPLALYVKNVRVPVESLSAPIGNFPTPLARDAMLASGQMAGMKDVGPIIDPATGRQVEAREQGGGAWEQPPVRVTNAIGFTIQKGTERGLQVAEEGRSGWAVREGETKISLEQIKGFGQLTGSLRIDRFSVNEDTAMIQVDINPRERADAWVTAYEAAPRDQAPTLIDSNGSRYDAVGFVYEDSTMKWIRYTRGQPLQALAGADMPQVTRNTPDRKLRLLFVVSKGVTIKEFKIGGQTVESLDLNTDPSALR